MGLESVAGKYNATIKTEGDMHILSVSLEDSVQKTGKKVLDGNMKKCTQQIMALVPSVGQVQWTYSLISSEEADETVLKISNLTETLLIHLKLCLKSRFSCPNDGRLISASCDIMKGY